MSTDKLSAQSSAEADELPKELVDEVVGAEPELSPLQRLRHSTAHVMAKAVQRLFPNVKVAIGPAIDTGFYYDFDTEKPFSDEDLEKIEAEMQKIIDAERSDLFDVLAHVAYALPPLSREERAAKE